jgi:hypothetical protein
LPALKVNIIIVHPRGVVFPRALLLLSALKVNIIFVHPRALLLLPALKVNIKLLITYF